MIGINPLSNTSQNRPCGGRPWIGLTGAGPI